VGLLDIKRGVDELGPVDYDKAPPETYRCMSCAATNRRLWRDYNTFLSSQILLCKSCALVDQQKNIERYQVDSRVKSDQVGSLIPAVPTEEGETFWGYSSVPAAGIAWWYAIAETCTDVDDEPARLRRRLEIWKKSHAGAVELADIYKKWLREAREGEEK
jgi:hypothetical protein